MAPPDVAGGDLKCRRAFDTVMESCDGRDIGTDDDQAAKEPDEDSRDYASAGEPDDGDDEVADDGPEIV